MLCIVDNYPKHLLMDNELRLSKDSLSLWKKQHGIADWTFGGGLYGSKSQIRAQKKLVKKHLSTYGKLRFLNDSSTHTFWGKVYHSLVIAGAKLEGKSQAFISQIFPARNLFKGKPTDDFAKQVYFKSDSSRPTQHFSPANDNCGFIWTGPLVPFTAKHVEDVINIGELVFKEYQFDFFVELIVESPRTLIALFGVFFNPKLSEEKERARNWYSSIHQKMNEAGYVAYRETSTSTGSAMDGNLQLKNFLSQIKLKIDPNEILAPNRYGISGEAAKKTKISTEAL